MITELRKKIIIEHADFLKNRSFIEFGVNTGNSLLEIYNLYNDNIKDLNTEFYGFDSFKGLPQEIIDKNNPSYWTHNQPNFLDFNLQEHKIKEIKELLNKPKITLIEGWFEDTLTPELNKTFKQKIGLLHIDCDIYTSTYQVLDFCFKYNLLESGTIIMYDDWGGYHDKLGEGHEFEAGEGLVHAQIMEKYNRTCVYKEKIIVTSGYHEIAVFILE
jgi:hypothetical protein